MHEHTRTAVRVRHLRGREPARVLGDMGMISSRTAKIILGASVFDDILGVLLLAVVDGLAH